MLRINTIKYKNIYYMLKQLKHKDLKPLREKWWLENGKKCPILDIEFPLEDIVIDHQHKLKADLPDESGKGICRGAISRNTNSWEGKCCNSFKRLGLEKYIDLPTALRNLADYLECNKQHEEEKLIHPSEKPKSPKLTKASYNELVKAIDGKQQIPKYSGNLSKRLNLLYEKYEITPKFYSK